MREDEINWQVSTANQSQPYKGVHPIKTHLLKWAQPIKIYLKITLNGLHYSCIKLAFVHLPFTIIIIK